MYAISTRWGSPCLCVWCVEWTEGDAVSVNGRRESNRKRDSSCGLQNAVVAEPCTIGLALDLVVEPTPGIDCPLRSAAVLVGESKPAVNDLVPNLAGGFEFVELGLTNRGLRELPPLRESAREVVVGAPGAALRLRR